MTLKSIAEQATNAAVLSETFADSTQPISTTQLDDAFRNVLRIGDRQPSRQPQEAFIPPSLGMYEQNIPTSEAKTSILKFSLT